MTFQEAMLTHLPFTRKGFEYTSYQYFAPLTGPHSDLLACAYFVATEGGEGMLQTSLDLYPEELLSTDWELVPNSNKMVLYTK